MNEQCFAPDFSLSGKRILVTGASKGIGFAAASAVAELGAEVVMVARSHKDILQAAGLLQARGLNATAASVDITDRAAVAEFVASQDVFDGLVNNAGCNRPGPFTDATEEDFDSVFGLNVKAAYFTAQQVVKKMIASNKSGSLVHISSQMGHVGGPNRTLYCGSKWAVEGMNKAMALDLAKYNIRSNTLCPTFIETEMTAPFFEDAAFKASVLEKIKLGRLGSVHDLTGAVVFLCSDASALMTGTSMVIDGGWTAE